MKVLLATEGSKFSRAALKECGRILANSDNAELRIISVAETPVVVTEPFAISPMYVEELDRAVRERAERYALEAQAELKKEFPGLSATITVKTITGSPDQMIVEEAESWGADLIVTGSHGYGFWKRAWLGSVSSSVVHHAPCSVLVVRPQAAVTSNGR
ncbi:MAG: universal stress protein [Acidobacteriota bacterium]